MKKIPVIFFLFLLGCSSKQEPGKTTTEPVIVEAYFPQDDESGSRFSFETTYRNLSREFNAKVLIRRYNSANEANDSSVVTISLTDKNDTIIFDTVSVTSKFYNRTFFIDSTNVRSYSTKMNINKQVTDNYFGDIIVADLNFDGRDDIAIINDAGGNGGAFYSYFLQDDKKKFHIDSYLTNSMVYFPTKINRHQHTLVTYVHAGACCVGEHVYSFDKSGQQWVEKSHRIIKL